MSAPLVCPIRLVSVSLMSQVVTTTMLARPKNVEELGKLIDKSDRNCNTHRCALWDKRRKRCGLTTIGGK